jgi:hypothetical protein
LKFEWHEAESKASLREIGDLTLKMKSIQLKIGKDGKPVLPKGSANSKKIDAITYFKV